MTGKTKGIILNQIHYSDSGIIARVYTRKYGRQSFLVRGMRKKKSGRHNIFFQPLSILDLEMNYKPSREMQNLQEFTVSYSPSGIYSDMKKSSVAMFLSEVLATVLREEAENEELFDYIEESIKYFDRIEDHYANFHIAFLSGLASFLGFEPGKREKDEDIFFDMSDGKFVMLPPVHGNYATPGISGILNEFFNSSYEGASRISLSGAVRNEVLENLLQYFSVHLPGLKKINSLDVLKEVFS